MYLACDDPDRGRCGGDRDGLSGGAGSKLLDVGTAADPIDEEIAGLEQMYVALLTAAR